MPHVTMAPDNLPGTPGLMLYRQETGRPLSQLAEVLLRNEQSLSRADRELIAAQTSALNDCQFCLLTHSEMSAQQHPEGRAMVDKVLADPDSAPISPKLKALLKIAAAAQESGHAVTEELVGAARAAGATDTELHDTVLIAAAFCMYNRYCDGLAAVAPEDPAVYIPLAKMIIREGYSTCATGH
jgi:uncharacterized peroxidase-related enzyme